ncbi:HAO1 [Bugula neritina]|uniref:(S)-2-hydroxy-acid oxidase n=1 Tax=Bugula neritina TaxID=10212 RepID=A0A7J7J2P4_BUGNE|nr:HAO1 [Bugula neritina]
MLISYSDLETIEDYRKEAKKCFEPSFEKYVAGGAGSQPDDNAKAFNNYLLRPYLVNDVSKINTSTTILGHAVDFPLCICPMGMQYKIDKRAEHIPATAAKRKRVGFAMSGWASTTMEDLVTGSETGLKFLNIYIYKKRDWTENLVRRAEAAGFHGFVLGLAKLNPAASPAIVHSPATSYANIKQFTQAVEPSDPDYPMPDVSVTWSDIAWLKSITRLPVIVKGVLSARDAIQAASAGADAILVSNHGGRQFCPVPAPIDVLPEVVAAVGHQCEVYMDGGVRSGANLFTALALGAKAVFVGRPILWGMACEGVQGVEKVLEIYKKDLTHTMIMAANLSFNAVYFKSFITFTPKFHLYRVSPAVYKHL